MIIDRSYFYGNTAIAQLDVSSVQKSVDKFIAQYEPEFLKEVLGYEFKKLYDAGIAADTQIYKDIKDGKEYSSLSLGRKLYKWEGLTFGSVIKMSPIANYIYFKYMTYNQSFTTGSGEKVAQTGAATHVGTSEKMVYAWNEMVDWNIGLVDFLVSNDDVYPTYIDQRYYNWKFFDKVNSFGI